MNNEKNVIPDPINKCSIVKPTNQYDNNLVDNKNLYIKELEEENKRLKAEIEDWNDRILSIMTNQDISKCKQVEEVEEAFRETKNYLENLINYANAPIIVWDLDYRITRFNQAFERLTGYSANEVLGKNLVILFPDEEKDESMELIYRTTSGERWEVVEIPIAHVNGDVRTVLWNSATIFAEDGTTILSTIAQGQDITERKKVEVAYREKNDYLENLINYANAPIIVWDPDYRITRFNQAFERLTGYSANEVLGKNLKILFPNEQKDESMELIYRTTSGERWEVVEIPIAHVNGDVRTVLWNSATIFAEDGTTVIATIAQGQDITQRKKMEKTIQESEEKFFKAFNNNPGIMTITDLSDNKYIDINEAFCRITGYKREEVVGRTVTESITSPLKLADRVEIRKKLMQEGIIQNMEVDFYDKIGEKRIGLLSADLVNIDGQECALEVIRDITDFKQIEVEMTRLDRLNLVGEIAASIGHEIRNPMTTVRGFLQILRGNKNYVQEMEHFDLMIEELDIANSIITEFLSLANNKMVELKPQNINAIIQKLLPLVQANAMIKDQSIKAELEEMPDMLLDEKEIRQLIINVVCNGLESMSSAGEIIIRTFEEKGNVVLAIKDQGSGIDCELLDKLGTPFFTTKERGTGLGLAVCYRIANRHKAKIDIDTNSTGTTFYVRFTSPTIAAEAQ